VLGLSWIILIPLFMVAVYTFVFGVILKSAWYSRAASPMEIPLIYFVGLMILNFFLEVVNRAPNFIRNNSIYVKKVIFPIDLLNWVLVGTAGVKLAISFALLTIFLTAVEGRVPSGILLVPVLLLPLAILLLGLAWLLSAVGTYVRDLGHAITASSPVIMFVSPVFYSLEQVPEPFREIYMVNPLTFVLEGVRKLLFFEGRISWPGYCAYTFVSICVFVAGFHFFERARAGFADVV
jgi:lipopolysaccharide transport system permease protein